MKVEAIKNLWMVDGSFETLLVVAGGSGIGQYG